MTQSSLTTGPSPTGLILRQENNLHHETLASNSKGATFPSVFFDGQLCIRDHVTPNELYIRSASSWVFLTHIDPSFKRNYAGNPNGIITGNVAGEFLYDTTNSILWTYTGTGTVWYNTQGNINSTLAPAFPTLYHEVKAEYIGVSSFKLLAGSHVRDVADSVNISYVADMVLSTATTGAGGLDAGTVASNTWYYVYAIFNPSSGVSSAVISTVNESVTGSITLPAGYTKKRQLKIVVRTDASSNIKPFLYVNNEDTFYLEENNGDNQANIVISGGAGTFTAVSCASFVPPTSRLAYVLDDGGAGTTYNRITGVETHTGRSTGASGSYSAQYQILLSSSQQFDYRRNVGSTTLAIMGYKNTEIK